VRSLSPEEAELWDRVAATIRPLSRKAIALIGPEPIAPKSATSAAGPRRAAATTPAHNPPSIADRTLDGSWDKKLRSGSVQPDRVLDLHGLTLDGAWSAIDRGLDQAIAGGDRVILLITGHHRPGEPPVQRGKIRAAVHDWLAASRHASSIAAVRGAHRRHGGGGSLYLILKRKLPRR
jgi:DNA-nicking Smr family endonuclease